MQKLNSPPNQQTKLKYRMLQALLDDYMLQLRESVVQQQIAILQNIQKDDVNLQQRNEFLKGNLLNQIPREQINKIVSTYITSLQNQLEAEICMPLPHSESGQNNNIGRRYCEIGPRSSELQLQKIMPFTLQHRQLSNRFKRSSKELVKWPSQLKNNSRLPQSQTLNGLLNSTQTTKFHTSIRKHVQPTNSYNQLVDQTLVQYFYTRKNKIFKKTNKQNRLTEAQFERKENNYIKNCASDKRFNLKKITGLKNNHNFEIRKDTGKPTDWNGYDLLSCKQSIKKSRNQVHLTNQFKPIRDNRQLVQAQDLLRSRIVCLQSEVYNRIPCLVEMGVRFKRLKRKK